MNPALVVKLRPTGPWRIGPDSGARNRVDVDLPQRFALFRGHRGHGAAGHAGRMAGRDRAQRRGARRVLQLLLSVSGRHRLRGSAAHHLAARPRRAAAPRVRWKSARFVPLGVVAALLGRAGAGRRPLVRGRRERMPAARGTPRPVPHRRALERRGRPPERRHASATPPPASNSAPARASGPWSPSRMRSRSRALVRPRARRFPPAGRFRFRRRTVARLGPLRSPGVCGRRAARDDSAGRHGDAGTRRRGDRRACSAPHRGRGSARGRRRPWPPAPGPRPPAASRHWLLSLFTPAPADAVDWQRGNYTVAGARRPHRESRPLGRTQEAVAHGVRKAPCWWPAKRCAAARRT